MAASKLPKLSEMQKAREEREMRRHVGDSLMALVKRAGAEGLAIPISALRDLKAGDSMAIEVVPGEGLLLRYFNAADAAKKQRDGTGLRPAPDADETEPDAG